MHICGSHSQSIDSMGLRFSPGICILMPHPHPYRTLAQCTLGHTLRNKAKNLLENSQKRQTNDTSEYIIAAPFLLMSSVPQPITQGVLTPLA